METRKKKSFKRLFAFLMAFVMVTTLAVSAVFAADPTFKDVPKDYEFYDEIEDLAAKKIVSGYGDTGLFKPEEKLTRAQAAKMIAGAAGIKVSAGFKTAFTDVDEDVDMYEHIWALEEAKIVKGWGSTNEFRPDEAIERGHVAKMIALAFGIDVGSKEVEFKDLPADKEVADAIMALASNDIVKGYGTTGEFRPEEPVLRGQFSKMVSRAMNLEFEILEVKAITTTGVDVTFDALAEDMEDTTIEVIDNNGNVVEVNPLNLVINETEGAFIFKTALTAAPKGIWTVAGIKYDADAAAQLKAINDAITELGLWNALKAAGIKNLVVENSGLYIDELPTDDFETLAEVQEYVDEVNNSVLDDEATEEIMEAIVDAQKAKSEVQLLAVLDSFARVNEDFITDYNQATYDGAGEWTASLIGAQAITPGTTTMKQVQTAIDTVNVTEVNGLIATAEGTPTRANYNKAVKTMSYVRADDAEAVPADTVKADFQDRLDELNLVINVLEAKTAAQFTNAYNALVAFVDDDTTIGGEEYYTALRTQYMTNAATAVDVADIAEAIVKANTQKRAELFNDVANVVNTAGATQTSTADVLAKLQALAVFVPDADDFDIETVVTTESRLKAYRANFASNLTAVDETAFTGAASPSAVEALIQSVQTQVTNANDTAVTAPLGLIENFDESSDDADDLLALLKNAELSLTNVVDANKVAYFDDILVVEAAATVGGGTAAEAIEALEVALKDINLLVDINKAATAEEIHTALLALSGNDDYINVPSADRLWVAEKVLVARNAETGKLFATLDDLMGSSEALETAAGAHTTALAGVNNLTLASTITDVVTALSAVDADYAKLSAAVKADIAEAFFLGLEFNETTGKVSPAFRTLAAIKTAAGL